MPLQPGTHRFSPEDSTLSLLTGREGRAARAGHDLLIEVTSWRATLIHAGDAARSSVEVAVDPSSLRVVEGSGGIKALSADDRAKIEGTIGADVLQGREIAFSSRSVLPIPDDGKIQVEGDLKIGDRVGTISFDLEVGVDGALKAATVVRQTDWGLKPYSTMLGALRVRDEVEVVFEQWGDSEPSRT